MALIDDLFADAPAEAPTPRLDPERRGEVLIDELIGSTGHRAVEGSVDLERILALPRRSPPISPASAGWLGAITQHMTKFLRKTATGPCRCRALGLPDCILELLPVQAATLYEASRAGGELGLIGVGHGKTGIDILLPMVMPGCKTALLLIPPSLRAQFFQVDFPAWSQHFRTPTLAGTQPPWETGAPVLHVMAYSMLSNEKSTDFLTQLQPDLIIADESHSLRNGIARGGKPPSSGAGRVFRYLADHPEVRFCNHTGSMTTRSGCDYFHLGAFALKEGSPLPLDQDTAENWAAVIDPGPKPAPLGELAKLCNPGERVRRGFGRRLAETFGVITTRESPVATPLSYHHRKIPQLPSDVREALRATRRDDERPDGEVLIDEFARAKCIRELSSGFYYRWCFPRGELVSVIERWFAVRKAWMKELRVQLTQPAEHLDSPLLLSKAAKRWHEGYKWTDEKGTEHAEPAKSRRGPLAVWESACWPEWVEVRDQVKPETETMWLSDFLIGDAAEWASNHLGIVWYENVAFGQRLAEVTGLQLFGGGEEASDAIKSEKGNRTIIASRDAHGTGKNLQHAFCRNLIEYPMSDAGAWEQTVGRTHRYGQKAPEVEVYYYAHTEEMRNALERAKRAAEYIEETTENTQKLCFGQWD